MLFNWLITGGLLVINPAQAVRGPKHVVRRGKTPVLTEDQARRLLAGIAVVKTVRAPDGSQVEMPDLAGLRDRALIGVMTYAFARIGAVVAMRVEDYYPAGKRWWVRLHEKGGRRHEMPAHHKLEAFIDEYLAAAGIRADGKGPLFRSAIGRTGVLTDTLMNRVDAYRMIRRRTAEAGFKIKLGCHVFRATGITAYLEAGGTLENAQAMAAHESPRTTKLYDRTGDEITSTRLNESQSDRVSLWLVSRQIVKGVHHLAAGKIDFEHLVDRLADDGELIERATKQTPLQRTPDVGNQDNEAGMQWLGRVQPPVIGCVVGDQHEIFGDGVARGTPVIPTGAANMDDMSGLMAGFSGDGNQLGREAFVDQNPHGAMSSSLCRTTRTGGRSCHGCLRGRPRSG